MTGDGSGGAIGGVAGTVRDRTEARGSGDARGDRGESSGRAHAHRTDPNRRGRAEPPGPFVMSADLTKSFDRFVTRDQVGA